MLNPTLQSNIIEFSPDGICTIDHEGNICYINNALSKLLGFDNKSDLANKRWTDFVDKGLELFIKDHVVPIVLVSRSWQGELCILTKSNERLFADVTMIRLNSAYYSLLVKDITNHKNFNSEMNSRQLRLSMINFLSKLIISDTSVHDVIKKCFIHIYKYFPNTRISYWKKISGAKFYCEFVKESPIYRDLEVILNKEHVFDNSLLTIAENNSGFCYVGTPLNIVFTGGNNSNESISYIQPIFLHKTFVSFINMEFFDSVNKGSDISLLLKEISDYFSLSMLKEQSLVERDYAVNTMKQSEDKYKNLFETIDDLIFTVSENGIILSVNSAFEKLTGWHQEFVINKNIIDFLCPENSKNALNDIVTIAFGKNDKLLECKFLTSKKTTIDIELKMVSNFIANKSNSIICVGRDITERKRRELKILEQASLIELIHDAVVVIDNEMRITYLNKSAQKLFNESESGNILGRSIFDLFNNSNNDNLDNVFEVIRINNSWVGEFNLKLKSGKEIIIESSWTKISNPNNKQDSILIINTDLTEKKQMETQFYRKQRMESLGTLSSGIAHDFNNILTPIVISLEVLKQRYKDERADKIIDTLQQTVNRGAELVNKILSFSRGTNIKNKIISPPIMINEMMKIIIETFPKSILISTNIEENIWNISGDVTQLDQVILNIFVNARDAMPNGGEIKVEVSNRTIKSDTQIFNSIMSAGDYVSISISDTGNGIDPVAIEKIFEPFFTTKPIGKGTGLGLSTSYATIKSHKGHIEVKSKIGIGTNFTLYFPKSLSDQISEPSNKLEQQKLINSNETVLIIDDEPAILEMYKYLLSFNGFKLFSANDGVEALNLFYANENKIKTVITDINMPNMNGITLARLIKKRNKNIKIIGVTGNLENVNKISSERLFDFILEKPFNITSLYKALSSAHITDPNVSIA